MVGGTLWTRWHSHTVETVQHFDFNLSIPDIACYIPSRSTASASHWASIWIEVKERSEVTRNGNWLSGKVEYINLPLALLPLALAHKFQLYCMAASTFKTDLIVWGLNDPLQPFLLPPKQLVYCHNLLFLVCLSDLGEQAWTECSRETGRKNPLTKDPGAGQPSSGQGFVR